MEISIDKLKYSENYFIARCRNGSAKNQKNKDIYNKIGDIMAHCNNNVCMVLNTTHKVIQIKDVGRICVILLYPCVLAN